MRGAEFDVRWQWALCGIERFVLRPMGATIGGGHWSKLDDIGRPGSQAGLEHGWSKLAQMMFKTPTIQSKLVCTYSASQSPAREFDIKQKWSGCSESSRLCLLGIYDLSHKRQEASRECGLRLKREGNAADHRGNGVHSCHSMLTINEDASRASCIKCPSLQKASDHRLHRLHTTHHPPGRVRSIRTTPGRAFSMVAN
jgi:hypothetical protein